MNTTISPLFPSYTAFILALHCLVGGLHAKDVLLRNKDGKSLSARLVQLEGDKLTVMRDSDKKQFVLALVQLDEASQSRVGDWVKSGGNRSEKYEIEVSTSKSNKRSELEDYDDRAVTMEPLVVVKNPDVKLTTKAANVTALFLGRPVNDRGGYYVFSTESFELSELEPGKQSVFQMKKFSHTYDNRGYAKYGARYLGWVVFIHEEGGNRIILAKSVPASLADKFTTKFLTLKEETYYDDELKLMKYGNSYSN